MQTLNMVGYMLVKSGEYKDAIKIMKKNMEEFPYNANAYDSLGEAYSSAGDLKNAKK